MYDEDQTFGLKRFFCTYVQNLQACQDILFLSFDNIFGYAAGHPKKKIPPLPPPLFFFLKKKKKKKNWGYTGMNGRFDAKDIIIKYYLIFKGIYC